MTNAASSKKYALDHARDEAQVRMAVLSAVYDATARGHPGVEVIGRDQDGAYGRTNRESRHGLTARRSLGVWGT